MRYFVLMLLFAVHLQAKEKKGEIRFPEEEMKGIEFTFSWGNKEKEPFEIYYGGEKKWPEKEEKQLTIPHFTWKSPIAEESPDPGE